MSDVDGTGKVLFTAFPIVAGVMDFYLILGTVPQGGGALPNVCVRTHLTPILILGILGHLVHSYLL